MKKLRTAMRYWENFWNCSLSNRPKDSLTGALSSTVFGYEIKRCTYYFMLIIQMHKSPCTWWIRCKQRATTWAHHSACGLQLQLQETIFFRSKVTDVLWLGFPPPGVTVANKWNPIWSGSLTALIFVKCSPLTNSSADPFARQEYNRMSSSCSGKLQ